MTNNGFGTLLILLERIKRDIAQTWEGLQRTTCMFETTNKLIWSERRKILNEPPVGLEQQMNWYDEQGREILKEPR